MNYDLILVGTSFASSFFLKKYLEKSSSDVKVLVLERGEFEPHSKRLTAAKNTPFGKVSFISSTSNKESYINLTPDKPWLFDPSFGGSSNCWTGCTPRFMPADFQLKTKYGVGMDWPFDYDEIEKYYCEAEDIMGISGPQNTPYPMSAPYPFGPHKLNTVDEILNKHYQDLYISQPTARASSNGKRNKCCNSSICHLCPISAKFTIENGLMYLYEDPRVTLQFGTQAISLDMVGGVAKGVVARSKDRIVTYAGDTIALGANSIFNAHILLNSGDTNPNTGKYLSEQVGYYCYIDLNNLDNVGGSTIITANGFMLYDIAYRSIGAACLIESHSDGFIRSEHGKWRHIAKFKFVFEDIPQESNQVLAGEDELFPQVKYTGHSTYVNKGYDNLKEQIHTIFSPLPVENIMLDSNAQASESHILGTTRMHKSATLGVVDENQIHHSLRNVLVLGGSVFPTISPANPTLTLSALSLRAADKLF